MAVRPQSGGGKGDSCFPTPPLPQTPSHPTWPIHHSCLLWNPVVKTAKADYIRQQITDCTGHSQFYRITDEALHLSSKPKFPSHKPTQELAERLNNFFGSKLCSIREELDSSYSPSQIHLQAQFTCSATPVMDMFDPVNEEELLHIIAASPSKSCLLDPILTWFLKQHVGLLSPVITSIVNASLQTGKFPSAFKGSAGLCTPTSVI